jgi:pimeloyl-ACP methyl ester carboxylesterase
MIDLSISVNSPVVQFTQAGGLMLEKLIANATLDIIEECGHEPPVEAPARFLQILEKLIIH